MVEWETRDDRVIAISAMTDSHLCNAINFMQRRINRLEEEEDHCWSALCMSRGEMATYYAEQAANRVADVRCYAQVSLQALKRELEKRKITCP